MREHSSLFEGPEVTWRSSSFCFCLDPVLQPFRPLSLYLLRCGSLSSILQWLQRRIHGLSIKSCYDRIGLRDQHLNIQKTMDHNTMHTRFDKSPHATIFEMLLSNVWHPQVKWTVAWKTGSIALQLIKWLSCDVNKDIQISMHGSWKGGETSTTEFLKLKVVCRAKRPYTWIN